MRTRSTWTAAMVVLAAGFLAWSQDLGASQATPATDGPRRVVLVEHAVTDTIVDLDLAGDSIGDTFAFGNPVFDAANRTEIGRRLGSCDRVEVGVAWHCVVTTVLPEGQISTHGPFYDQGDSTLSIVGGTGVYAGADGALTMRARNAEGSEYDLMFEIL